MIGKITAKFSRHWKNPPSCIGLCVVGFLLFFLSGGLAMTEDVADQPYILDVPIVSRSISFENPTGAPGEGGRAASPLGPGRKGAPSRLLEAGETVTLCDIEGPGAIRHIWLTTNPEPEALLGLVIRAYWEGQEHPAIEASVGNFFGVSHGMVHGQAYQSAVHSVNSEAGMNIWLPMPFAKRARFTLENKSTVSRPVFYNIDYTLGDAPAEPFGRLHVLFRRENPTTLGSDFEILPRREGRGRYVGCVLGVRPYAPDWWGEGEVKVYLDGDDKHPTIVGTGTEDYIGHSWGVQPATYMYGGASLLPDGRVSFYRWHLRDPIYWKESIRVTIQQIGWGGNGLFERQDDWCATTFWYEPIPSAALPPMPDYRARTDYDPIPGLETNSAPDSKP